jgi:PadR family transcriptional regulator PadR
MILLSRSEEIVLLSIWKLKGNAYGVTIREQISLDTGHEWSFGAIYKPLKKLLHRDFVEKTSSQPCAERGGRSKYLYTLTSSGTEALREIRKIYKAIWTEESKISFD